MAAVVQKRRCAYNQEGDFSYETTAQKSCLLDFTKAGSITLSDRDAKRFVEVSLNPPPPNRNLIEAMRRHKEMIGEERDDGVDYYVKDFDGMILGEKKLTPKEIKSD